MKIEMKSPAQREQEVIKGLTEDKTVSAKVKIYFGDIKNFFKKFKWLGLVLLLLAGCCPHLLKCVP